MAPSAMRIDGTGEAQAALTREQLMRSRAAFRARAVDL
jgi:hypothetical protein